VTELRINEDIDYIQYIIDCEDLDAVLKARKESFNKLHKNLCTEKINVLFKHGSAPDNV
jgi:hypothetical protein